MADTNRSRLQLQIPPFLFNTEPTLVPGGGAEIIPLSNQSWFANNGFTNSFTHHASFHPHSTMTMSRQEEDFTHSQERSTSAPFTFELPPQEEQSQPPSLPAPISNPDFSIFLASKQPPTSSPSTEPPSVPVYSATGFDLMGILARVATRPNPKVFLGPVDLTCSFVVVDVRRFDHPIIYCSPNFTTLTGYTEAEVIGRNCRFLQARDGNVRKGDIRRDTSHEAVSHLKRSLLANKECQTSIVNYKKDGTPFINLVTVIPLLGGLSNNPEDENEYIYQVGFQVNLTDQPNAILEKLKHGSYLVNYSSPSDFAARQNQLSRDRKVATIPLPPTSKDLKDLIADRTFLDSIPLSTNAITPQPSPNAIGPSSDDAGPGHHLNLLLLESTPDFVHVVSLKGTFLYVAPSVRRVLGYEPEEMLSGSLADYAHPEDVVPLMRELKESSAMGGAVPDVGGSNSSSSGIVPRSVNLLFRARTKMGRYVWVECRGRLHVEPGKGRKAIILTGRAREMANLKWEDVKSAGGLAKGIRTSLPSQDGGKSAWRLVDQEVWGLLTGHGKDTMTFLSIGKGAEDVLGWKAGDLLGRSVNDIVADEEVKVALGDVVTNMRASQRQRTGVSNSDTLGVRKVRCSLKKKDGTIADVWFIIYRTDPNSDQDPINPARDRISQDGQAGLSIASAPLVYQIRPFEAETFIPGSADPFTLTLPTSEPDSVLPQEVPPSFVASSAPSLSPSLATDQCRSSPWVEFFEELATSRGSSWQYELQQLRFANVRLRQQLAHLDSPDDDPTPPPVDNSDSHPLGASEDLPSRPHLEPQNVDPIHVTNSNIGSGSRLHTHRLHSHPHHQDSDFPTMLAYNRPLLPLPSGASIPSWQTRSPVPVATTMNISRDGGRLMKRPWSMSK